MNIYWLYEERERDSMNYGIPRNEDMILKKYKQKKLSYSALRYNVY